MINHIEQLEISSYRGINCLSLPDLGSVNIFVGDNNTGKTSVLEAIQFLCAPDQYNLVRIARQREMYRTRMGINFLDSVKYLFDIEQRNSKNYELSVGGKIHGKEVKVSVKGMVEQQLIDLQELSQKQYIPKWRLENASEENVEVFLGAIHNSIGHNEELEEFEINKYSNIRMNRSKEVILPCKMVLTVDHVIDNAFNSLIRTSEIKNLAVKLLRDEFDNNIVDLRIISDVESSRFTPVVEIESGEYIPLSLYGDGMKKALTMLNAIINTRKGITLIDEFETALHTSAMKKVFSFVVEAARALEVQLFLTTHSLEAVDKMLESGGEYIENMRVIRLKKKNGKTYSHIMDGCEALENRKEYDLELRI